MRLDLESAFSNYVDEFLEFDRIEHPLNPRPDLCAFLMLEALAPCKGDIVSAAEHDVIGLNVDMEMLAAKVTPEQVRDLHRCGVRYDSSFNCLSMLT